jgi:hypothetical protein
MTGTSLAGRAQTAATGKPGILDAARHRATPPGAQFNPEILHPARVNACWLRSHARTRTGR